MTIPFKMPDEATRDAVEFPIPLPKYTFIHAPPADSLALSLSEALANRDSSLGLFDFEAPLRRATQELFFSNLAPTDDWRLRHIPFSEEGAKQTASSWLKVFRDFVEICLGETVLAKIAISELEEGGESFFYQRFLWRDANSFTVAEFEDHYGHDKCFQIFFETAPIVAPERSIWLPRGLSVAKMVETLEKALTP